MGTSRDAPTLDMAYKLVAYAGRGRLKLAPGKKILPGEKQVFRREERRGGARVAVGDTHARASEDPPGRPLQVPVMAGGERLPAGRESLDDARARAREEIALLPERLRGLEPAETPYPVAVSAALRAYPEETIARVEGAEPDPAPTGRPT